VVLGNFIRTKIEGFEYFIEMEKGKEKRTEDVE